MENRLSETGGKVRDRATKGRLFGRGGESTRGNRGIRAFETWEETWRGAERIRRKVFVAPIEKVESRGTTIKRKVGGSICPVSNPLANFSPRNIESPR